MKGRPHGLHQRRPTKPRQRLVLPPAADGQAAVEANATSAEMESLRAIARTAEARLRDAERERDRLAAEVKTLKTEAADLRLDLDDAVRLLEELCGVE